MRAPDIKPQQPERKSEPTMEVPVRLMQIILNYLANHPYAQVFGIISEIQKLQIPLPMAQKPMPKHEPEVGSEKS